jgi:hypothetical protein
VANVNQNTRRNPMRALLIVVVLIAGCSRQPADPPLTKEQRDALDDLVKFRKEATARHQAIERDLDREDAIWKKLTQLTIDFDDSKIEDANYRAALMSGIAVFRDMTKHDKPAACDWAEQRLIGKTREQIKAQAADEKWTGYTPQHP